MTELKPCECGWTPALIEIQKCDTPQRFVRVWCANCGNYLKATTIGGSITDEEVVEAWNRRMSYDSD